MNTLPLSSERPEAPLFCDGLGDRVVAADGATGELLQILRVRPSLTAVPSFEFALRERAARLANFRHAYYARVRRIDRVQVPAPGLAIVSDHIEGTRLSDILRSTDERNLQLDINTALCLIRQLVPAVALMHENAREVAHGLISPERLIVTPHARLVIVEHVLGAAIEQLQFSRERLWQEFRVALPSSAGMLRFDHRADVTGVGLVALALVIGRPLRADEYPHQIPNLLSAARERTGLGEEQPLSAPLRDWLARALQLDPRRAFSSAPEALAILEDLVADESTYVAAPIALETFMSRYTAALLEPAMPAQPKAPEAAPAPIVNLIPAAPKPLAPKPVVAEPRPTPTLDLASLMSAAAATSGSSPAPLAPLAVPGIESPVPAFMRSVPSTPPEPTARLCRLRLRRRHMLEPTHRRQGHNRFRCDLSSRSRGYTDYPRRRLRVPLWFRQRRGACPSRSRSSRRRCNRRRRFGTSRSSSRRTTSLPTRTGAGSSSTITRCQRTRRPSNPLSRRRSRRHRSRRRDCPARGRSRPCMPPRRFWRWPRVVTSRCASRLAQRALRRWAPSMCSRAR